MMKRLLQGRLACWLCGVCLLLGSGMAPAGAAELPAALVGALQRYIALPDALLPVLEAAHDKPSADRAAADLQALLPRVYESRRELREIQALSPAEQEAVRKRFEMQMRTRWGRVFEQIFRLQRVHCYESIDFFKHFNTLCVMLEK